MSAVPQPRIDAATAAAEHADRVHTAWTDAALEHLVAFATASNEPWLAFDARLAAHYAGLPLAPDERAFGAVVRIAATRGLIRVHDYVRDPYGSPKPRWVAA